MTAEHEWPFELGSDKRVRPWFLSASGYLFAVFPDPEVAQRAQRGLVADGVSPADLRIDPGEEILRREAERSDENSVLTKALTAVTVDRHVRDLVFETAAAGGSVLWAYAPADDAANRLIRFLADFDYVLLRYYGHDGAVDLGPGAE